MPRQTAERRRLVKAEAAREEEQKRMQFAHSAALMRVRVPGIMRPLSVDEIMRVRHDAGLFSPLEVMLISMDRFVEQAEEIAVEMDKADSPEERGEIRARLKEMVLTATTIAKDAAPYCHAKLASVTVRRTDDEAPDLGLASVESLRARIRGPITIENDSADAAQ